MKGSMLDNEILPSVVDRELFRCDKRWRAKVFSLATDGTWVSEVTGYSQILHRVLQSLKAQEDAYFLQVVSESDEETLLNSKVTQQCEYSRQGRKRRTPA